MREILIIIWLALTLPLLSFSIPPFVSDSDKLDIEIQIQLDSVNTLINELKLDKAQQYLQKIDPKGSKTQMVEKEKLFGMILFHQGFYPKALAQFDKALTLHGAKEDLAYSDLFNWKGNSYLRLVDFDQAIASFIVALAIRKKKLGEMHERVGNVYNNLALAMEDKGDLDKAMEYHQKSLDIVIFNFGAEHVEAADGYLKIGDIQRRKKNYTIANKLYQRSLTILEDSLGIDHLRTAIAYYYLGALNKEMENNKKALSLLSKSVDTFERIYGKDHQKVNFLKSEITPIYLKMGQYEEAEAILNIIIPNYLERQEDGYLVAHAYESLGAVYLGKNEKEKASKYYDKAITIFKDQFGENHPNTFNAYLSLGKALHKQGDQVDALKALGTALNIGQSLYEKNPIQLSELYLVIGKCNLALGKCKISQNYLDLAHSLWDSAIEGEGKENPFINKELSEIEIAIVQVSLEKQRRHPDMASLYKAESLLVVIEKRLDYLKQQFQSIAAGQSVMGQFYDFYQHAIDLNYLLYQKTGDKSYLRKAFAFSEESKAFTLMRTLQKEEALLMAGIPDSIADKENELSAAITYQEKLVFEQSQSSEVDKTAISTSNDILFTLHKKQEELLRNIETIYPDYYRLKYAFNPVGVEAFQQTALSREQTLIEYFVADTSIYVFLIDKENFEVVVLPKKAGLEPAIHDFRASIYEYNPMLNQAQKIEDYARLGQSLYQQLIAPFQDKLRSNLIIVGSGFLEYLPFDALVIQAPIEKANFRSYKYLVMDFATSYAYSATWLEMVVTKEVSTFEKEYLGVAPEFTNNISVIRNGAREALSTLKYNREEIQNTNYLMKGDSLQGALATKENFEAIAGLYRILHLATHGKSNDQEGNYSFLAFSEPADSSGNVFFYVKDLLNLVIHAELVVLSACETGLGELQRAEGLVSVGKGFSYAGARSILTTFWQINDHTTAKFMPLFFEQLKKGVTKDKALQNAQNTFIQQNRDCHPFYWSSYSIYGDTAKMDFQHQPSFSKVMFGGMLTTLTMGLLGGLLFWWYNLKIANN